VAKGIVDVLQEGADRALGEAEAALAAPEAANLAPLLGAVDLPEVQGEGPLGALSVRLDREADLLRGIALRELARVSWIGKIAQTIVVAAGVAEILVGLGAAMSSGGQFLLAAFVIAGAAGVVALAAQVSRKAHASLAHDALERARTIEDRIFRLAIAMEWRAGDRGLYQEALARLEGTVSSA